MLKSGRLLSFEDTKKLIDDFIESYTITLKFEFFRNSKFGLNKKILQLKLHGSGDFAQCLQRRNRSLCFYIKKMTSRYAGFHRKPDYRNIFFNAESSYSVDHILYVFGHFDKLKILLIALYLE